MAHTDTDTVNVQRTGTQHLSRNVQEGILRSLTRNLLLANIGQSFISVDKRGWARGAYRFLASASLTLPEETAEILIELLGTLPDTQNSLVTRIIHHGMVI